MSVDQFRPQATGHREQENKNQGKTFNAEGMRQQRKEKRKCKSKFGKAKAKPEVPENET